MSPVTEADGLTMYYHIEVSAQVGWITLSPKAYQWWENLTAIRHRGDGYSVDLIPPSAVRYREAGRSITFSSEPLWQEKNTFVLAVYIHRPLKWDEPDLGEVSDATQETTILARVETALKAKIGRYELVAQAT